MQATTTSSAAGSRLVPVTKLEERRGKGRHDGQHRDRDPRRGLFLGMQELLRRRDGVISTRVGYTGGDPRIYDARRGRKDGTPPPFL